MTINNLSAAWQAAYDVLVKGMRALLDNLRNVLGPDDTRWLSFGLQMPSTVTTPGQPVNLTGNLDDTGAIVVQCDAVPLATRYRWRMLLVGFPHRAEVTLWHAHHLAALLRLASYPATMTLTVLLHAPTRPSPTR